MRTASWTLTSAPASSNKRTTSLWPSVHTCTQHHHHQQYCYENEFAWWHMIMQQTECMYVGSFRSIILVHGKSVWKLIPVIAINSNLGPILHHFGEAMTEKYHFSEPPPLSYAIDWVYSFDFYMNIVPWLSVILKTSWSERESFWHSTSTW